MLLLSMLPFFCGEDGHSPEQLRAISSRYHQLLDEEFTPEVVHLFRILFRNRYFKDEYSAYQQFQKLHHCATSTSLCGTDKLLLQMTLAEVNEFFFAGDDFVATPSYGQLGKEDKQILLDTAAKLYEDRNQVNIAKAEDAAKILAFLDAVLQGEIFEMKTAHAKILIEQTVLVEPLLPCHAIRWIKYLCYFDLAELAKDFFAAYDHILCRPIRYPFKNELSRIEGICFTAVFSGHQTFVAQFLNLRPRYLPKEIYQRIQVLYEDAKELGFPVRFHFNPVFSAVSVYDLWAQYPDDLGLTLLLLKQSNWFHPEILRFGYRNNTMCAKAAVTTDSDSFSLLSARLKSHPLILQIMNNTDEI